MFCGTTALITGCSDNDNKVVIKPPVKEQLADEDKQPTDDQQPTDDKQPVDDDKPKDDDKDPEEPKIAEGTLLELRIMETTDLHANLMNFNYFSNKEDNKVGLVKTATLIRQAREAATNSVLVDNGDLIQGSPLGDYMAKIKGLKDGEVHPIYGAMNTLDYDVANIGNHEFNFGLEFLDEAIDDAKFPYISANVFKDDGDDDPSNDEPLFTPYIIKDKQVVDKNGDTQTLKIGYIGFVPPQIMQWDKANLEGQVIAKDIVEMAKHYVPKMKEAGADIIVAIPHSGLETAEKKPLAENASYYLSKVDGIDAIMFGHAHANFPGPRYAGLEEHGVDNEKGTINGVAAVMPGFWGNNLGIIDMTLEYSAEGWQVKDAQSTLDPISITNPDRTVTSLAINDAQVENAAMAAHDETKTWVNEPFAKISDEVNSYFALVNDDPSIQIVTDAQLWYTQAIVKGTELDELPVLSAGAPFRAGRGGADDFTAVDKGDIAYRNVADLYIYPNVLKVLKLNGAEVKQWLEMSAGQFNQITPNTDTVQVLVNPDFPSYNFDVLDGVSYQIDVTEPARYDTKGNKVSDGNRIKALTYQGEPVTDEQVFLVATNNYRASGGGNFPGISGEKIAVDSPNENRQVVADYISLQSNKTPETGMDPSADGNWSFAPVAGANVVFYSSPSDKATAFSARFAHITPLNQTTENGFAIYQIDLTQPAN
ncbi:bifunctional 2',3'-cyclic-nucleotide 2'-phosphodiesterase/3'-nucleotidase [Pseudoalteromonas sp. R3]|nr:bifunctional 2',3'-cyclic-nucleotide 2'-phosphodiesterase/3'-nucleotidase [Pseudoalteromonas sp. R3]